MICMFSAKALKISPSLKLKIAFTVLRSEYNYSEQNLTCSAQPTIS